MDNFGFFEIFAGILAFFYALIPSYGLAIILLTLTTRIVLLPLSIKQTRSMREMQVIQPQVKALQKKHRGDRQKLNEEMMKLYKEHGVNPLGGCLPLLMQFPVLIALYQVILRPVRYLGDTALKTDLENSFETVNGFLGIRLDCSPSTSYDAAANCGSGIDIWPYALLLGLMGLTTWYQQKQMQSNRGSDQAAQQQMIGRIMPVILVVIGFGFPAGVLIYWFASNVWTIVQQRIILKAAPPLVGGDGGAKGAKASKGASPAKATKASKATGAEPPAAKGNGATARPRSSKPHPSSKKKKR